MTGSFSPDEGIARWNKLILDSSADIAFLANNKPAADRTTKHAACRRDIKFMLVPILVIGSG